jgi:hypothetical protein
VNNELIISLTNAVVICQNWFLLQSYDFTDVTGGNPVSAISRFATKHDLAFDCD